MQSEPLSISLPPTLLEFIEHYKTTHHFQTNAQVVEQALALLQQQELEDAYRQAAQEVDEAWESTIADGLSHETW